MDYNHEINVRGLVAGKTSKEIRNRIQIYTKRHYKNNYTNAKIGSFKLKMF